ncbi:tetratricopeptide repeat protein [Bacteroidales bacterium OttesenSCG-928-C03]|nr:tetratricopeptide repeat protein [Bacteroidales bacterium OttesenSCG-928-C03]MDL2325929.1 tetratricopeptide repeat protein [Bacteroidales bacterium OttesenSCG-928-A14]
MNRIRHTHLLLFVAGLLIACSSCSTRKNTFPNRAYHTVTSKFNVNFNAKEALKEGEADLAKKHKDNFTTQLPVYNYPAKTDISSISPAMDKTIEKCSKSIYKHSMLIRGKEYVKTMDDVYLLMGKAYFHKQDYGQAQRIFNYINSNYKGTQWNCREEAMIWSIRTAIRQEYYSSALVNLDEVAYLLHKSKDKKLKVLYNAAGAEYHLTAPDGDIMSAIDYLNEAIANKPKKAFKIRLYFILGQLYEEVGQLKEAQRCFQKVIKSTPEYEMEFNAHIHLAMNYDGTPSSRVSIMKNLERMLEESKNVDFRDQIYYALSTISKKDEDEEEEQMYLAKSVAAYTNNDYQCTFSSILLADMLFENEEYVSAQNYYDTALMVLPNNYPNREQIVKKGNILRGLVDNLMVVETQDSLQRIAKMSEPQRSAWVQSMISAYTEEERRIAKEEADRMRVLEATGGMRNINVTSSDGSWYFYNQSLVTRGKTEFYRLWGNRKLEDNWRVSNKQQLSFEEMARLNDPSAKEETEEYDEDGNLIVKRETDPKKPAFYTQDLPLTPGAMDTSNMMIVEAMYNAAIIYLDDLDDVKRSNETFRKLITRFPDHELTLPSLYLLYRNLLQANDPAHSEPKNTILTKYPDTDYARLISDPDYYKRLEDIEKEYERKYEEVYLAYSKKKWRQTIAAADEAIANVVDEELKSKYEYLRAVAVGQVISEDSLKASMKHIIKTYPKTGVAELARIYLSLFPDSEELMSEINSMGNEIEAVENAQVEYFTYQPKEMHYIVVIINIGKHAVSDVKNDISNFNAQYFSLQRFNVNSFYINQNEQMISVSRFKDKDAAMEYYNAIAQNELFKPSIVLKSMRINVMSATNYTTFYNNIPSRETYEEFFEKNYLEKK